jgi:hypothetical protein
MFPYVQVVPKKCEEMWNQAPFQSATYCDKALQKRGKGVTGFFGEPYDGKPSCTVRRGGYTNPY